MPELSRFLGIIIRMYLEAGERHNTPHFHAYYQNESAVFDIEEIRLIAGNIPKRQQRYVKLWAELHREELFKDWELLQNGRLPLPIKPLI
ncbi:MAG: DUF4160 domain-containing protein [Ignavibacteria bacterium]